MHELQFAPHDWHTPPALLVAVEYCPEAHDETQAWETKLYVAIQEVHTELDEHVAQFDEHAEHVPGALVVAVENWPTGQVAIHAFEESA